MPKPRLALKLLFAFATVYIVWGSTFFAIKIGIGTLPPLLLAALRFLSAGGFLYVTFRLKGARRPNLSHWKGAAIIGILMLTIANGGLCFAEQQVPTGLASLVSATPPLWIALLNWLGFARKRPTLQTFVGVALGLVGILALVWGEDWTVDAATPIYVIVLALSPLGWALGSVINRRTLHPSRLLSGGMEMLAGGAVLLVLSWLLGEWRGFSLSQVSVASWVALFYLSVFGSVIAYSVFGWLLRLVLPARASTTSFVNPIVAVVLGSVFLHEALTLSMLVSGACIVVSVALIVTQRRTIKIADPL